MLTTHKEIMEHALASYNFGEDITISSSGSWKEEEKGHYTCILSVDVITGQDREIYSDVQDHNSYNMSEAKDAVSFHVKFEYGTAKLEEVYGLLMSTGGDVGSPGHSLNYDAVAV